MVTEEIKLCLFCTHLEHDTGSCWSTLTGCDSDEWVCEKRQFGWLAAYDKEGFQQVNLKAKNCEYFEWDSSINRKD